MNEITKDMTIYEVLQINPDIAPVFMEFGMHCVGCAIAHGVSADEMLKRLNEFNDASKK